METVTSPSGMSITPAAGLELQGDWTRRLLYRLWVGLLVGLLASASPRVPSSAAPAADSLTRFSYTRRVLGTDARITLYAPDAQAAERASEAAFARMRELELLLGDEPGSELARLSGEAGGTPIPVSPDLFIVLRRAQEVAERSGGAFDVTAGPLTALWLSARKAGSPPDATELESARKRVGWRKLRLEESARTVQLELPGMKLDLDGIAWGYAADEALRVLKQQGVTRASVELGGVTVVGDPPPGRSGWLLGVPGAAGKPSRQRLASSALATAGRGARTIRPGVPPAVGTIDPRTGQALSSSFQVAVVAHDGLTAAPLAAALSVLGPEGRDGLLAAYPGATAVVRAPAGVSAASGEEGWKPLFDGKSLAGWKRTEFVGGGDVRVESPFRDGPAAIVVEAGGTLSGFNWTGDAPRTNYEIALEAMKIKGDDFMCGLTFPVGDSYASLILGGWGGWIVGISSIDGADASENPTTRYMEFPPNRWYRVRLRVTPRKIEAWLDDKSIVDQDITGKQISLRFGDIRLSVPIGISTYQTSSAFRNIRLRLLPAGPESDSTPAPTFTR